MIEIDELEDLKQIVFVLRHKCDDLRKVGPAITRIQDHTKLPRKRIVELLKKYFKGE